MGKQLKQYQAEADQYAEQEAENNKREFLALTSQVRQLILQSNPQSEHGLATAGELFKEWLDEMPTPVRDALYEQFSINLYF